MRDRFEAKPLTHFNSSSRPLLSTISRLLQNGCRQKITGSLTPFPVLKRLEITSEILQAVLVTIRYTHDDINIYAVFCTALTGFLHIGEFTWSTWNNRSFPQSLSHESIQFVRDGIILKLPASKTDPFRKGVSIPLSP